ncbi:citrate lyase subunit beta/citryl-CoA lyase [Pararhizobium capsulatum DSM 1112]|uniref:Citrate lyase subunit beta/citryl-CoA lyase n=1 Tax=Pararhizobium capsulatum DSM 1112 TaxID=1121113 RepID=A0ABU0BR72_9HYPH|nr:CoA ester lyase [Pararhizobium capsulatum]MDQ0320743.1 citrate lyase subunit beta/citryl-CoA lyase [Pararhizobium capsulatum DSM 1112]
MRLRSLLFVPGDRPERFEKAMASGADAIILDLEDSVVSAAKGRAREFIAEFLSRRTPNCAIFVRVNPLDTDDLEKDLSIFGSGLPDALVLPKAEGAAFVRALSVRVSEQAGVSIPILPIATETPAAIFQLGSYAQVGSEICGLTWGAEDLPAAIGATAAREADGGYTEPYRMVRSLALFAAHAAGVPAIETVYPDIRDIAGLVAYARRGRRDGFTGMLAVHPAQVEVINRAFTPSAEEILRAERIIGAFAANPEAGTIQVDGRMLDRPHLKLAMAIVQSSTDS